MTHTVWEPPSGLAGSLWGFPTAVRVYLLFAEAERHFRAWKMLTLSVWLGSWFACVSSHSDANKLGLYSLEGDFHPHSPTKASDSHNSSLNIVFHGRPWRPDSKDAHF